MPLFDSHCHFDFDQFDADRGALVESAEAVGLRGIVLPGVSLSHSSRQRVCAELLAARGWTVACGVGVHPYFLPPEAEAAPLLVALGRELEAQGASLVGECGLDAPWSKKGGASLELQEALLRGQLELALQYRLPVVVHAVGAHGRLLGILRELGPFSAGLVLHAYSGSPELVPEYERLGAFFGFGAAPLRPGARRPVLALRAVSSGRLLVETDAPDQPLVGDTRNTPAALARIVEGLAALRGESPSELAAHTWTNALSLFGESREE